jgi:hypothetical protein
LIILIILGEEYIGITNTQTSLSGNVLFENVAEYLRPM